MEDLEVEPLLDDNWIQEFEEKDKLYNHFYKEDVHSIHLTMLYVNSDRELQQIKQETRLLSVPNRLTYEELCKIIKDHAHSYSLHSIVKYNFDIEPDHLKLYLSDTWKQTSSDPYLTVLSHIDTLHFQKTIAMFQDMNELIFLFYKKENKDRTHSHKRHVHLIHKKTIKKR